MSELAELTARLERMNTHGGRSVNMDGGASSVIGVVDASGNKLLEIASETTGGAVNFVAFTPACTGDQ